MLVAAPRREGWLIDDAYVPHWSMNSSGKELWNAFATDAAGQTVRFVCPVYEPERIVYAMAAGLTIQETWWLKELSSTGGGAGAKVDLPGAEAITVGAPPVYAPGGPMLFLPAPQDAKTAVPAALEKAVELGCAGVVNQMAGDDDLAMVLTQTGLRRHCDYVTGVVRPR